MRQATFDPAGLLPAAQKRFKRLAKRASDATDAMYDVHRSGGRPDPDNGQAIWRDIKEFLLDEVFGRKCAYCEGNTDAHAPQHAEHWRPKNAVSEEPGHPGYWWLSLDWDNLVPACNNCNSGRGKVAQFPIAGSYVFSPDAVKDIDELDGVERPLLLHPWRGEPPEEHLEFLKDGRVCARNKSNYGQTTIKVLDLNREPLVELRKAQIKAARRAMAEAAGNILDDRDPEETWNGFTNGAATFSRAVTDVIGPRMAKLRAFLQQELGRP
jgi:uncharacterized protein (TIGR02646 family)